MYREDGDRAPGGSPGLFEVTGARADGEGVGPSEESGAGGEGKREIAV